MEDLQDKVAVLAGGAHGIGRATACALARAGVRVVLADLGCAPDGRGSDPEAAADAVRELEALGARALAVTVDVAERDAPRLLAARAEAHFGRLDFGLYFAGYHHDRAMLRDDDEALERALAVHLLGPLRFAREIGRALMAQKRGGSIVLASSTAAFLGTAGHSALASAAGGVVSFVRTAAAELRRQGVRINALVPTARTRLTENLPLFASIRADSLTSDHVAQVALYLLSEAAREVQGEAIGVAGGRIYAFRHAETSGAFHDEAGPPELSEIAARFREVTRR